MYSQNTDRTDEGNTVHATQAIAIRVDDEITWPNQIPLANHAGRVIRVGYETVTVVETGHDASHAIPLDLSEVRVQKPRLQAGDIVVLAPVPDEPSPDRRQGVVQPARWTDGRRFTVQWEHDDLRTQHRAAELSRVPIPDQHPALWPAAQLAAN